MVCVRVAAWHQCCSISTPMECWHAKEKKVVGVGVELRNKLDKKLFSRYTRNALQRELCECAFADDGAFLASTRAGAEVAVTEFQSTSSDFGWA